MELELHGRRALVTGSSSGIGAAIADALAAEGCHVLVHGRDRESAAAVAERVRSVGVEADVVLGDLMTAGVAERVTEAALGFGAQILVNNAGPFTEHSWESAEPHDWLAAFDGNVVTAVRTTTAVLPSIRARGWGRVINIGSRAVTTPLPNMVEYSAAKASVVNMTTSLAQHLAGSGVTVNCVSPGVILTPSFENMMKKRAAARPAGERDWARLEAEATSQYAPNPVGRLGRAEDVAHAVTFLASPLAGYINGVNLRVDGGITGTP